MTDTEGGVATYMRCFLKYRTRNKFYVVLVLISSDNQGKNPIGGFQADEIIHVCRNRYENVFYFLKTLTAFIHSPDDIILANERTELSMSNLFKLPNKLINIIHGDSAYYYDNVSGYQGVVDGFIATSDFILKKAQLLLEQASGNNSIRKIFAPVEHIRLGNPVSEKICKIIYTGRIDESKGSQHIIGICRELDKLGVAYKTTVVGTGALAEKIVRESKQLRGEIVLPGFVPNEKLLHLLKENEIMLFPSYSEAVGLSVVEAMKAGLVPVTSDLPSGLPEIVIENITGFRVPIGDERQFAEKIAFLHRHRDKTKAMRDAAIKLANELFSPEDQSEKIEHFIDEVSDFSRVKIFRSMRYGFRLDSKYLPNFLTILIRKTASKILFLLPAVL